MGWAQHVVVQLAFSLILAHGAEGACWRAGDRLMLVPGSRHAVWEKDRCATLDHDICDDDVVAYVHFDGDKRTVPCTYEDLQRCDSCLRAGTLVSIVSYAGDLPVKERGCGVLLSDLCNGGDGSAGVRFDDGRLPGEAWDYWSLQRCRKAQSLVRRSEAIQAEKKDLEKVEAKLRDKRSEWQRLETKEASAAAKEAALKVEQQEVDDKEKADEQQEERLQQEWQRVKTTESFLKEVQQKLDAQARHEDQQKAGLQKEEWVEQLREGGIIVLVSMTSIPVLVCALVYKLQLRQPAAESQYISFQGYQEARGRGWGHDVQGWPSSGGPPVSAPVRLPAGSTQAGEA